MTLWNQLIEPRNPDGRLIVWHDGAGFVSHSWAELVVTGRRAAVGLRRLGVEPGTAVASVLTNSFDACAGMLGVWMAGGVLISLPTPARGLAVEEYVTQLTDLCTKADARLLLLDDDLVSAGIELPAGPRVVGFAGLPTDGRLEVALPAADAPAFVQCSSGSTSGPKGCVLTPRAIAAQLLALERRLELEATDIGYSWLPLSHDMGLFGALMSVWATGASLVLGNPLRFLRSPRTWLEDCGATQATVTVGPGFGLSLAMRAARRFAPPGDLALRTWIIGSDPIEMTTVEEASARLGPLGLAPSAFTPAFGLAEATLAVTMTERQALPTATSVSLDALYDGELRESSGQESMTRVTSCGPPVAGTQVRIDGDRDIGEIVVRSASLAEGYLAAPERTARAFRGGELFTGDLGFMRGGELYVIGRRDDMMSVGGRNIPAGEVESRVEDDPRIRDGACVLVDVDRAGRRELVVVSEPTAEDVDFAATAQTIRRTASAIAGIGVSECVFVPRGSLPKSPSGKVQRFRCRKLVTDSGSRALARVQTG
jgi:fatty-acyl-CoA synthase